MQIPQAVGINVMQSILHAASYPASFGVLQSIT